MARLMMALCMLVVLWGCGDEDELAMRSAPDQALLSFDEAAAVAANGDYPSADPKRICGADDRRFLVELTQGNPLEYKIPKRLADIKAAPSEIMIAGTAVERSLGTGDFPFDHTFGSDFNMDVSLDAAYASAAQNRGVVGGTLHVELAEGQLPHPPAPAGPLTGEEWEAMSARARATVVSRFIPDAGSRVLVMGHWIVDCGHTNFQTELHPLTFLATSRVSGQTNIASAFYNPYRETQLYHPDPAKALAFDDPTRFSDHAFQPFPGELIADLFRLQDLGPAPYTSIDHFESWAVLEPNRVSPVTWRVCAPSGSNGTHLEVKYHWVARPGVHIDVRADEASSCAIVQTSLGTSTPARPQQRVCVLPWDFLSEVAGEEAGIEHLDLRDQLRAFVAPEFQNRINPDPIMNCYDPLAGPELEAEPTSTQIDTDANLLMPFYGVISVALAP